MNDLLFFLPNILKFLNDNTHSSQDFLIVDLKVELDLWTCFCEFEYLKAQTAKHAMHSYLCMFKII